MMKQIKEQMTETTTALGELKKTVGNGRTVRVDMSKLSEYAVGVLDERLSVAVEERIQRIESILDGYEQRVADIGAQKVAETAQKVDTVIDKANKGLRLWSATSAIWSPWRGAYLGRRSEELPLLCYRCSPRSCSWVASCGVLRALHN